jgi:hypothetical protein
MNPLGFGSAGFFIGATVLIEIVTLADPKYASGGGRRRMRTSSRGRHKGGAGAKPRVINVGDSALPP